MPKPAWDNLMAALSIDPNHESARANLLAVAQDLARTEDAARLLSRYGDKR